ncbi:MAG: GntR family transcriptional regulator [Firmicutes bacterium]|nr:GntR family transcriptional regulator [Bacillota bacterium]
MQQNVITGESSLAEEVTEILRTRIITGEYEMGEKLIENKIANELKVSRTPVRDAFKQLTKEGLINYIPNKGCFAKGFTQKDMADVYAVRKAVEELAITRAVENATDENISALKEQLDLMSFYTQHGFYEKLLQANEDFHNMIYQMTSSRFIVQVLRAYQDYVHLARKTTLSKEENLPEIYEEHVRIFEAIRDRDIERAKAESASHLDGSARRAMERWKEMGAAGK